MLEVIRFPSILVVATATFLSSPSAGLAQAPGSAVVPLKHTSIVTMDKRIEAVHGDHTKPGEPFVIRIHAEAGYIIMPHTHPVDENIVVIQGSWALGMGDRFKRQSLEPLEVGDYAFAGKGMAHFALAKSDTIVQVHGIGPFSVHWVVPVYELTEHGVLYKTLAEDPGRVAAKVPQDCFALKLGVHVHGSYGDGVVVGAQCTPGELTQYRIQRPDGARFWALSDELKTL